MHPAHPSTTVETSVRAEGKYALNRMGQTITDFLKQRSVRHGIDYLNRLRELFAARAAGKTAQAEFEKEVTGIIDAVNAFDRIPCDRITLAPISRLEQFEQLDFWRREAEKKILDDEFAFEGFYAGVGERMNRGPFYAIDPWSVVDEYLVSGSKPENYTVPKEAIRGLGLGPRQLLQLRICLEELSGKHNIDPVVTISHFTIVLHVNSQVESMLRRDLHQRRHYGFEPKNVIIVPQPVLPGWHFNAAGILALDPRSKTFPYNHGWARMQLNWPEQAYWMDNKGRDHSLPEAVVDHLLSKGVRYLTLNRINDLDRISPLGILDVDLIALSLYLMQKQGYSLTVELVGNDTGQKGGLGLAEEGSEDMFLVETLCAKSKPFMERMNRLTENFKNTLSWHNEEEKKSSKIGVPYNAMRQVEDIQATKDALKDGLPVVLRFREGCIYLEVPTGDMTNLPGIRTRAVMRMHDRFNLAIHSGELIYDFKRLEDAYKAPPFLVSQEQQARFRTLTYTLAALVRPSVSNPLPPD